MMIEVLSGGDLDTGSHLVMMLVLIPSLGRAHHIVGVGIGMNEAGPNTIK